MCVQQFEDIKWYILASYCFLLLQKRREIVQKKSLSLISLTVTLPKGRVA